MDVTEPIISYFEYYKSIVYYSGFGTKARVEKCGPFFLLVAKWGVIVPGVPGGERENWGREVRQLADRVLALREQHNLQNAVFCEESFGKNHALYAHLTYKDVERYRNRSVHEFYSLKASQMSKVHTSSHEITN